MLKKIILGQVRHLLSASGGGFYIWLMNHGVEPTDIEAIATGVIAVIAAIWSGYDKYQQEKLKQKEKV